LLKTSSNRSPRRSDYYGPKTLDYPPAKFFRRQIIRRKLERRDQAELAPVIAPLPESLQQIFIAAPRLLIHLIVSKYCDHQPLYQQEQDLLGSASGLVAAWLAESN
jgi:hypothetical protein